MRLKLGEKIVWAFALALVPLVIMAIASFTSVSGLLDAGERQRQSEQIQTELARLLGHVIEAETGVRGFVITGKDNFLEPYRAAAGVIDTDLVTLKRLLANHSKDALLLDTVKPIFAAMLNAWAQTIALRRAEGFTPAQRVVAAEAGKRSVDATRTIIAKIVDTQAQISAQRQADMQANAKYTRRVLVLTAMLGFLITLSASISFHGELGKRKRVEDDLRSAHDDLDRRVTLRTQQLEALNLALRQEASEKQRAQQMIDRVSNRFKRALTAAQVGAWEWELETDQVSTYGYMLPLYGLCEEQHAGARSDFTGRLHADDRERVEQLLKRAALGEIEFDTDFRVVWPDQSVHWLLGKGALMKNDHGKPLHMVGINMDMTELKLAQQERERLLVNEQELRSKAEAANRLKDEFLATVSHELRTPLNAILGWITLLRKGGLDAQGTTRALETVERNARSQTKLIEDLLDVSQIITGHLKLDVHRVDLPTIVQSALESVYPAAEARQITLTALLDSAGGSVWGDPQRMQQIVWNLLSNAIKFTEKGGKVQIKIERVESHMEIAVSDSGQGISAKFLPHVFERFEQEDASTTRRHGGLGLGLAIVRQLVELHGGQVSAASAGEGKGSTFRVLLPIMLAQRKIVQPEQRPAAPSRAAAAAAQNLLTGLRVLTVDDEADARELLAELLGGLGVDVRVASTAFDALGILESWRPDVLISDIGMPDMDGYELLRELRRRELHAPQATRLPALALTAYANGEDRMLALQSGFQMHMAKPLDPDELTTVLASLAGRLDSRVSVDASAQIQA